ncbi:MAG: methylated-DNA-protein-cysteine methyltransferase-like protein [Candidatus Paceibacteria bacterium]|jgi:methylated-DNA-protein-cysteine methyltransferase-like protein
MKKPGLFSVKLREIARSIPKGKVTTYGLLARAAGAGGQAARSVSRILANDPNRDSIPFHRIVYSGGKVWTNKDRNKHRVEKLKKEGIPIDEKGRIEMFQDYLYLK